MKKVLTLSSTPLDMEIHTYEYLKNLCFRIGILFSNQFIILCCSNRRAMIKDSVGNGLPLALTGTGYF